ncbi:MAG TPA: undecaprenyl-diphosphate phosphatase [Candidatus Sulfotelmatobacter sp.]|nr:undecaprenyl-diphosphate phosphatase [Candidatus Sulfotelmatobacter sp.]
MLTYFQAIVIGIFQGVSELFPVSSLGHSVIIPYLLGWNNIIKSQTASESFFLAFLVTLHVATALALLIFYWKEWVKLIKAFFSSIRYRRIHSSYERLIWLIIIATIPAGITGLVFEHSLRTQFAKPLSAAIFLFINGIILIVGDNYARKRAKRESDFSLEQTVAHTSKSITPIRAGLIGTSQVLALIAGISRSGITMVSGIFSGLDYEDSARFSFLLATPIILAAGLYKIPDLTGPNGHGVIGQVMVGAVFAFIAALLSVRFLDKYFRGKSLRPFGIYSLSIATFVIIVGLVRGHF